jgi:hypothetical protein
MIFDPKIELELLESQPEWIDVNSKIQTLTNELAHWTNRLSNDPKDWIAKKVQLIEKDLKLFENILLFWASNYNKLKLVSEAIERQTKVVNKGADILDLIADLQIAHKFEYQENLILAQTFIKLCEKNNIESSDKIKSALMELAINTKKYNDFLKVKLKEMIDE